MLEHYKVIPSIKFAGIHLYTWVERGTVRVKCLAQQHNTMSLARARTQTTKYVKRTNYEASNKTSKIYITQQNNNNIYLYQKGNN